MSSGFALRSFRAMSQAPSWSCSGLGRWAAGATSHAAAAARQDLPAAPMQQSAAAGNAASSPAVMSPMSRSQRPSFQSIGSSLPFAMSGLPASSSCSSICTSAATAVQAAGGGPTTPASGEESSDEESTPHSERRPREDPDLRLKAKLAMADPLSRLMASRGMPLGISMEQVAAGSSAPGADSSSQGGQQPYPMEALSDIFQTTKGGRQPTQGDDEVPGTATDSWGTTQESPAEIARRLVESNRDLEAMGIPDEKFDEDDEELVLSPGEAKYKTLEQMSKDIKGLDEVFDVLASVPWLDESNVQQKELKGVAMVGLLGTLEEVGFNIRGQILRIWEGERDHSIITECSEAKDQAALISILFHTKRLEEEYGPPSKA